MLYAAINPRETLDSGAAETYRDNMRSIEGMQRREARREASLPMISLRTSAAALPVIEQAARAAGLTKSRFCRLAVEAAAGVVNGASLQDASQIASPAPVFVPAVPVRFRSADAQPERRQPYTAEIPRESAPIAAQAAPIQAQNGIPLPHSRPNLPVQTPRQPPKRVGWFTDR